MRKFLVAIVLLVPALALGQVPAVHPERNDSGQADGARAKGPRLDSNNVWRGTNTFPLSNSTVYVDCHLYSCSPDIGAGITAAANSLPPCTSESSTWTHCGTVLIPSGTYVQETAVTEDGPVHIRGQGKLATKIEPNFSGTAFTFTADPFNGDQSSNSAESWGFSGLDDMSIDGTNAGPGSAGVEASNITGFEAHDLGIQNFAAAGDDCFYETATSYLVPLERFNVDIELDNCTVGWYSYFPSPGGGSSGYGQHTFHINPNDGQIAVLFNGAGIQEDSIHLIVNGSSDKTTGPTGIVLENNSAWESDLATVHMEAMSVGIETDSTSDFIGNGQFDIESTVTPYDFNAASHATVFGGTLAAAHGLGIEPVNNGVTFHLGLPRDCTFTNAIEEICAPEAFSTSIPLLGLDVGASGGIFQVESDGSVYDRPGGSGHPLYHYVLQPGPSSGYGTIPNTPAPYVSTTSPIIASGFGSSSAITQANGTIETELTVGRGGTATTGQLIMPPAKHGWDCRVQDITTPDKTTAETAFSTTSVTLTASAAWNPSDILLIHCGAF